MKNNPATGKIINRRRVCETETPGVQETKFDQYLEITLNGSKILIFKDYHYKISYYNGDTKSFITVSGIVLDFVSSSTNPSIKMVYNNGDREEQVTENNTILCNKNCNFFNYCHNKKSIYAESYTKNRCDCKLYNKTESNNEPYGYEYIPVSNITHIEYSYSTTGCYQDIIVPKKDEVKILLLGICATEIRSLIINMKFIDDQMDKAFKEINLKVGNRYRIVYNAPSDDTSNYTSCNCGSTYEIEGTLKDIQSICDSDRDPNTSNSIVRTVNCDHPEEIVGLHNSIYPSIDVSTDKDKFHVAEPVKSDYYLIFDTTDRPMHSTYDKIRLSQIRDVEIISIGDMSNDEGCCCEEKIYRVTSSTDEIIKVGDRSYIYNNGNIYFKDGTSCGKSIPMTEILKYYFGE